MTAHTDDPIDLVRAGFAEACEGLEENATITRARAAVDSALTIIVSNTRLVIEHERPRQQAVAKARAERDAAAKAQAERERAAFEGRVAARKQRRAALKGKVK